MAAAVAVVVAIASIASAGYAVYSGIQQANLAEQQQDEYKKEIERQNEIARQQNSAAAADMELAALAQEKTSRDILIMSEMNASLELAETEEAAKRLEREQDKTRSLAIAKAAASGVTLDGSIGLYLGDMAQTMADEYNWLLRSGESKADIIRRAGSMEAASSVEQGRSLRAQADVYAFNAGQNLPSDKSYQGDYFSGIGTAISGASSVMQGVQGLSSAFSSAFTPVAPTTQAYIREAP